MTDQIFARKQTGIQERSFEFAIRIIHFYRDLKSGGQEAIILGKQVLRAGTSIGANIHEAQGGQSKADFIAKISIAHKEALETLYWLRLIQRAGLICPGLPSLIDETRQLIKILASILLTSKNGKKLATLHS